MFSFFTIITSVGKYFEVKHLPPAPFHEVRTTSARTGNSSALQSVYILAYDNLWDLNTKPIHLTDLILANSL